MAIQKGFMPNMGSVVEHGTNIILSEGTITSGNGSSILKVIIPCHFGVKSSQHSLYLVDYNSL